MALIPTLTDGVVRLRPPNDVDIEGSWEQCQDPVSRRWTKIPVPYTRDDARTYLRHIIPGGWETDREWAFVVEADDDNGLARFAGTLSLRNEGEGRAEIAYGSHPWARGRGVMERALRLLIEWGFAERDVRTVIWLARTRQLGLPTAGLEAGLRRGGHAAGLAAAAWGADRRLGGHAAPG